MERQVTTALSNALQEDTVSLITLVFLNFGPNNSDALFAHTSVGDLVADLGLDPPFTGNQTYSGLGNLGGVGRGEEDPSVFPSGLTLSLSGVDQDLLSHARDLDHFGRECRMFMGALDMATGNLIGFNELPKSGGLMDSLDWTSAEGGSFLEVAVRDERQLTKRGPAILYDDGQQQMRQAGDRFCKAALLEHKEVVAGPGSRDLNERNAQTPRRDDADFESYRGQR